MPGFWVKVALGKPRKALLSIPTWTPCWRQRQPSILIATLLRKCSSTSARPNSSLAYPHMKSEGLVCSAIYITKRVSMGCPWNISCMPLRRPWNNLQQQEGEKTLTRFRASWQAPKYNWAPDKSTGPNAKTVHDLNCKSLLWGPGSWVGTSQLQSTKDAASYTGFSRKAPDLREGA